MPTVARIGPYRFFFFSNEGSEPPHIHVQRDQRLAKYWLRPVRATMNSGFSSVELRKLERLVLLHRDEFLAAWQDYFHGS
ncbi:MAG: DUF4160 domain-containing protein [Planctomycetota bacterium]